MAIGGGTGLSTLLRGLKAYTGNITAIVAVADDGGSSGRLRQRAGIAPVGDIRNCIAALADAEPVMTRLLQYRFPSTPSGSGLVTGHAFGNLLIAALSDIGATSRKACGNRTACSPSAARSCRRGGAADPARRAGGRVAPGRPVAHRRRARHPARMDHPGRRPCQGGGDRGISGADMVVLGPGSLYTSLLPNLLLREIRDALVAAAGVRAYVVQRRHPAGRDGRLHLAGAPRGAERPFGADRIVDVVLTNNHSARGRSAARCEPAPVD